MSEIVFKQRLPPIWVYDFYVSMAQNYLMRVIVGPCHDKDETELILFNNMLKYQSYF